MFQELIEELKKTKQKIRNIKFDLTKREDRTAMSVLISTTRKIEEQLRPHKDSHPELYQYAKETVEEVKKSLPVFPMPGPNKGASDMKNTGLIFVDDKGVRHKAISVKEKLQKQTPAGIGEGSFGKILRARILGDPSDLNNGERKQLGESTGGGFGWFVPASLSDYVIDLARNQTAVMQAGAMTIQMYNPEMTLVKITGDPTAYWRAEHAEITESEPSVEPITLRATTIGVLVRVSLELLQDAPDAGVVLEGLIKQSIALEMDRIALLGSGTGEPRGLDNCSDVNETSMGDNGAALTDYDEFLLAMKDIELANGMPSACIYNPRTHYELQTLKEGSTLAPLQPPYEFAQLSKFRTNQVPITDTQGTASTASKAFIGDFTKMLFGIRSNLTMDTSKSATGSASEDSFSRLQVLIRGHARMDVAVIQENHFSKIVGIIPA